MRRSPNSKFLPMIKFRYILFLMIFSWMVSCQWGKPGEENPAITTDTLKYVYTTVKQKADDCGNKPDSGCTVFKMTYPVFEGKKALNDTVAIYLNKSFQTLENKANYTLQKLARQFIMMYQNDKKNNNRPNLIYQLDSKTTVIRQDSTLLTVEFTTYSYTGGAHGATSTHFLNWDTKTNKKVTLNNILADGYPSPLTAIAEKIFRRQEKLSDTSSLAHGYFFNNNRFALNDNYLLTPMGIRFHYNEYEIKPYAAGPTDLLVPYSQIESLLRPNTVINLYYK